MSSMHTHTLMTALVILVLVACGKESPPTPPPAPSAAKAEPAKAEPAKEAPVTAAGKPGAGIVTEVAVVKPTGSDEPMDAETRAKLAKVYMEIYCAQRRGESEKLLDIYTSNGFDDPEAWTKVWTRASKDGAWVAKTAQDAIDKCSQESPPTP